MRPENLTKWIMRNVPEDSLITYTHTEQYHDQFRQIFKNYTFSPDSVSINLESEVIERVTSETQRRILDLIDENSILKLRIKGYAGSGKSLIAKEILNKKLKKGESCYLINFSRPVTDNYLLDNNTLPNNCKCTTIAALLTDILNVASPSYVHKSFDETERELLNLLNNGQKISINPHCFILDEAQLMKENQYEILSRILENSPLIRQKSFFLIHARRYLTGIWKVVIFFFLIIRFIQSMRSIEILRKLRNFLSIPFIRADKSSVLF